MVFIKVENILKVIVMIWCKRNIKNVFFNKYSAHIIKWSGKILLFIAYISIIANIVGEVYFYDIDNKTQILLNFRYAIICTFSLIWFLSLFVNRNIMVVFWLLAFYYVYQQSLKVPELCNAWCYDYCIDNNCDTNVCIADRCNIKE